MVELKKAFMDAYDNNRDGRIDIRELAQLLPIEESFKLVFNFENKVNSSVEFMRVSLVGAFFAVSLVRKLTHSLKTSDLD